METYYEYLNWCKDYNECNLIDPSSDKMEWHHTLPQCIFGDTRIGLWLTLKQHAIATALQTLAFNRNCLCPWHKQHLPELIWERCLPLFREFCRVSTTLEQRSKNARVMLERRDRAYLQKNGTNVGVVANSEWRQNNPTAYVENRRRGAQTQHSQRWECTVTGHISTPGPLSCYQKARGIDHTNKSLRRRVS
jgi:hypothetical protein